PQGTWQNQLQGGLIFTGMLLAVERYLEVLDEGDAAAAARWLIAWQRADGSWEDHPGAPRGSLAATCVVYAGLAAAGAPLLAPAALMAPLQAVENARVVEYLGRWQNPGGDWLSVLPSTLLCAACLRALGAAAGDPRIARAHASWQRWKVRQGDGLYVVPFSSEV